MITRTLELARLVTDDHIRCSVCHKLLAERATRPWRIACVRCGHANTRPVRDWVPPAPPPPPLPPAVPTKRRRRSKARQLSLPKKT